MKIFTSYFILSFLIILFYNLGFSYKYPKISEMTYIINILTALLLFPTYFLERKKIYRIEEIEITSKVYIYILLNTLNFLYKGKIPLMEIILKTGYTHRDFEGIPILSVLILTYGIYLSALASYNIIISKTRKNIINYLLILLPYCLVYSRFLIIFSLLVFILNYIKIKKWNLKKYFVILIISFFSMYIFGILGNIRSGYKYNDSNLILRIGGANNKFLTSSIPQEFFWFYTYLTSSQANFEKTLYLQKPKENFKDFFIFSLIPEIIRKKITNEKQEGFTQISSALNGAPDITIPYVYYGWMGVVIFIILKCLYINIYVYIIVKRKNKYTIPSLSLMLCFLFFNFINNFYIYGGIILVIIYPLIFRIMEGKEWRIK